MKRDDLDRDIIRKFLLKEEEEDAGGEDLFGDTDEDLAADEEAGDEEAAEEEAGDEEAGDEDTAEESEEEPEEEPAEPGSGGSFIDSEIESVLIDFESKALGAATPIEISEDELSEETEEQNESRIYKSGIKILLEAEGPIFDTDVYASEVARLVKNYQNLIDMEAILIGKALDFVAEKYGEDAMADVKQSLEDKHDLSMESPEDEGIAPVAVGAFPGGSGA